MHREIMKKIYALYLPQFHRIPENDKWWGQGYTEWNAVREAKNYYKGQNQPKVPLNDNYYDLSDEDGNVWRWQVGLANNYGVDGFIIYHYWFKDNKKLLEKPAEILFKNDDISTCYFFCWANEPWRKTWYGNNLELLIDQDYGNENDWRIHFEYLKPFFLDKRYKKINNKPVFAIYKTASIDKLFEIKKLWDSLAKEIGFDGIYLLGAKTAFEQEQRANIVDGEYLFEPAYTLHYQYNKIQVAKRVVLRNIKKIYNRIFGEKRLIQIENLKDLYDAIELPNPVITKDIYYGLCPSWDNTPRKQHNGCAFINSSPDLFKLKLRSFLKSKKGGDFVVINAWNEWGEGAYLEPDTINGYGYLEAIKELKESDKNG